MTMRASAAVKDKYAPPLMVSLLNVRSHLSGGMCEHTHAHLCKLYEEPVTHSQSQVSVPLALYLECLTLLTMVLISSVIV